MAASETGGEFVFGYGVDLALQAFSQQAIADEVIWPLARHIALTAPGGGDDPLDYPDSGEYKGARYAVHLAVYADDEPDPQIYPRLSVEKLIKNSGDRPSPEASLILDSAKARTLEQYGTLEAIDKSGRLVWPEGSEKNFVVSLKHCFIFRGDIVHGISHTKLITGLDDDEPVCVPFDVGNEEEELPEPEPELWFPHVEAIAAACHIFEAPRSVMRSIECMLEEPAL